MTRSSHLEAPTPTAREYAAAMGLLRALEETLSVQLDDPDYDRLMSLRASTASSALSAAMTVGGAASHEFAAGFLRELMASSWARGA